MEPSNFIPWILIIFILICMMSIGIFNTFCDYKFKERFEIKEFEVSAGGFMQPPLVNIKTINDKNKVITLEDVYKSVSEIEEGDIIECKEIVKKRFYCSSTIQCEKIREEGK